MQQRTGFSQQFHDRRIPDLLGQEERRVARSVPDVDRGPARQELAEDARVRTHGCEVQRGVLGVVLGGEELKVRRGIEERGHGVDVAFSDRVAEGRECCGLRGHGGVERVRELGAVEGLPSACVCHRGILSSAHLVWISRCRICIAFASIDGTELQWIKKKETLYVLVFFCDLASETELHLMRDVVIIKSW